MAASDVDLVRITGRFAAIVGDGGDPDTAPDHVFASAGTVTFTPNTPATLKLEATEGPLIIGMSKIVATVDANGFLSVNGAPGVWLVNPASPNLSVRNWTYRVDFAGIKAGSLDIQVPTIAAFQPVSGVDNELSSLVPVPASPGITTPAVTGVIFGGVKYVGDVDLDDFDLGGGAGAVESVNGQTGVVVLNSADIGALASTYVPTWGEISGKPATFPPTIGSSSTAAVAGNDARLTNARTPTSHTHPSSQITDFSAAVSAIAQSVLSALIDGAPGTMDTLNELAAALADDPNFATTMTTALATKAPLSHGHTVANVSGLQALLDAKAPLSHAHTVANVSGLQAALDALAAEKMDTDAVMAYANAAPGSVFEIRRSSGGSWPARPTSRTDIHFHWVDPLDPAGAEPAGAIADVDTLIRRAEA